MKSILVLFFLVLILFKPSYSIADNKRYSTGIVMEISNNRIELDKPHTGSLSMIGFSCEPEICISTRDVKVGDKVLLVLGAVDRKNKLLSIRKCVVDDSDCRRVTDAEITEETERKRLLDVFQNEYAGCRAKMYADITDQFGSGEPTFEPSTSAPSNTQKAETCVENYLTEYRNAILTSCQKYDCGNRIGGGCYHIMGYSVTEKVLVDAEAKCNK